MADKTAGTLTTAVEAYDRPLGNSYRKSGDGFYGNELGGGAVEINGDGGVRAVNGEDAVDEVVLEQALQALETKKTSWYAYLTTKDFWLVLAIGYVLSATNSLYCKYTDSCIDKSSPSASLPRTLSPLSSSIKEPPFLHSRLSLTTFFLP